MGFNIDIMRAIEKAMGIEIELIPMKWSDAIEALDNGKIHGIQGMSKTEERKDKYLFTQHTVINSHSIFVLKDVEGLHGIEDLKGLRIALQKSDLQEERIKEIPEIIPIYHSNQIDCIRALLNG